MKGLGEFRCEVEREKRPSGSEGFLEVRTTRNGYQWSTLTLTDERQLAAVYTAIGAYLGRNGVPPA